ncbi:hypothetical protein LRM49_03070 [Candidatus Nanosynbacter sp. HMT-352]|uniref:hypothetical protein n=1 Tax=Candidatus Nanosynbacter sp. HMT-352 TaxID=2899133 RepID=UPI001FB849DA|nr:hypothetical protein [Candidatus Nanosynbacter sp. HMT-352]UOG67029.1 hypothetical protein LRM49_03070 [Candidatus Nanosynbacter sp. HMT-352]
MFEITDEFLTQAGFGSLPSDKKEQMREDVTNSVQDKIIRKILLAVGEAKLDEFMKLLDGDDVPAVLNWCADNGIDLTEIVQSSMNETMAELQKLYSDALNMVRG